MFQDPSFGEIKITYVVTNITMIDPAQVSGKICRSYLIPLTGVLSMTKKVKKYIMDRVCNNDKCLIFCSIVQWLQYKSYFIQPYSLNRLGLVFFLFPCCGQIHDILSVESYAGIWADLLKE